MHLRMSPVISIVLALELGGRLDPNKDNRCAVDAPFICVDEEPRTQMVACPSFSFSLNMLPLHVGFEFLPVHFKHHPRPNRRTRRAIRGG